MTGRPMASGARRPTLRCAISLQASGLKINPEANEHLLRAIAALRAKPASAAAAPSAGNGSDREIDRAVQAHARRSSALSPISATDRSSQPAFTIRKHASAIEKFERDHRLPVTGQISDRFVRELAAMTGRPLE